MHPQHDVSHVQSQADGGARGGVHARRGGAGVHDRDAEALLRRINGMRQGAHHRFERDEGVLEGGTAQGYGALEILCLHRFGNRLCLLYSFHQGQARHAVVADADHDRFIVRTEGEQRVDGFVSHHGGKDAVIGAGTPAALDVPEHGDTHLLAESLLEQALHVAGADVLAVAVAGALSQDHHAVAAPGFSSGFETFDQNVLPVVHIRRRFGDQHPVCAGRQRTHQGEVAAVASHHLDDESALVAGGGAGDGVHRLGDAVQGGVGADGHVGAAEVVVNRADQSYNGEIRVCRGFPGGDPARFGEFCDQRAPFLAEDVRAGQ